MKKQVYLFLIGLLLITVLGGCVQNKDDDTIILRIANWEEYIDEGGWDDEELIDLEDGTEIFGDENMIDLFEQWYKATYGEKVKIEYSTFGTNEDLYNQLTLGDTFDLMCPSEYMIMKLMTENKLTPFSDRFYDTDLEENYYARGISPYILDVFQNLEINGESLTKYGAGYMWGSMGIVYNPEVVSEEETRHWSMLLDKKYYKQITMKDSVREAYIVAQAIRKEDLFLKKEFIEAEDYTERLFDEINETDEEAVTDVEHILQKMRQNAYSLETDNGKADLVTGKVVANMQWSGDGVYTLDQAEEDGIELSFAVPEEASNLWFDGWCMLKKGIGEDERKQQAAEAFINFVSRPDNVIKNMYYVGYTSVIAGGENDLIYQYADWCYGADDEEEETVLYSLRYFFTDEEEDASDEFVLSVPKGEEDRQVFAQYPTREVIRRSAVMRCFSDEQNKRISTMWTNIRCFDWSDLFG